MMTKKGRDRLNKKFSILNSCSLLIIPLSTPICLAASISVKYPEYIDIYAKVNIIGIGCTIFIYGILFMTALGYLLSELSAHINSTEIETENDLKIVLKRLNRAYYIGGGLILVGSCNMMIFGSYDYLLRKVSYLLLFVRIIGIEVFFILIVTISKIAPANHRVGSTNSVSVTPKKDTSTKLKSVSASLVSVTPQNDTTTMGIPMSISKNNILDETGKIYEVAV